MKTALAQTGKLMPKSSKVYVINYNYYDLMIVVVLTSTR